MLQLVADNPYEPLKALGFLLVMSLSCQTLAVGILRRTKVTAFHDGVPALSLGFPLAFGWFSSEAIPRRCPECLSASIARASLDYDHH